MNRRDPWSVLRYVRHLTGFPKGDQTTDSELLTRFVANRDETAFAVLTHRYGPLVLGVCRRVLANEHDAEDAFQATFLVLASRVESIRRGESLGHWLYEVAYRIALQTREQTERRAWRERQNVLRRQATDMTGPDPSDEVVWDDLKSLLDEEVCRLDEKYRRPLVLCDLLGKTHSEAAEELGLPVGSVWNRLNQARELLRERLNRRGVVLSIAALAGLLQSRTAEAAVSATLTVRTVASAISFAATQPTTSAAKTLAVIFLGSTAGWRVKWLILLAVGLLASVGVAYTAGIFDSAQASPQIQTVATPSVSHPGATAETPRPTDEVRRTATLTGRITGPSGEAVPGASVTVVVPRLRTGSRRLSDEILCRGTVDADGRYQLEVPATVPGWYLDNPEVKLLVTAPGLAPTTRLVTLPSDLKIEGQNLSLTPAGVVHGRIVDSAGRPISAARVSLARAGLVWRPQSAENDISVSDWPAVASGTDGWFELKGVNLATGMSLDVRAERFAPKVVSVSPVQFGTKIVVGTVALQAARVLEGSVIAADTGKPLAGCCVTAINPGMAQTRFTLDPRAIDGQTGPDGRFRLELPAKKRFTLQVHPSEGGPYLASTRTMPWPADEGRCEISVALSRGITMGGSVVEMANGQAVADAIVMYVPHTPTSGQNRSEVPLVGPDALAFMLAEPNRTGSDEWEDVLTGVDSLVRTKKDGSFNITVPPGCGHLLVFGLTNEYVAREVDARRRYCAHAVVTLDLQPSDPPREQKISLTRGVAISGRVVGPDGTPVEDGSVLSRFRTSPYAPEMPVPVFFNNGRFVLSGCEPGRVYPLVINDKNGRFGAVVELPVPTGSGAEPVVRLASCSRATLRCVDAISRPVVGHQPRLMTMLPSSANGDGRSSNLFPRIWSSKPEDMMTDRDGKLVLTGLVPGVRYQIGHWVNGQWKPAHTFIAATGETLSLPDLLIPDETGFRFLKPGEKPSKQ